MRPPYWKGHEPCSSSSSCVLWRLANSYLVHHRHQPVRSVKPDSHSYLVICCDRQNAYLLPSVSVSFFPFRFFSFCLNYCMDMERWSSVVTVCCNNHWAVSYTTLSEERRFTNLIKWALSHCVFPPQIHFLLDLSINKYTVQILTELNSPASCHPYRRNVQMYAVINIFNYYYSI